MDISVILCLKKSHEFVFVQNYNFTVSLNVIYETIPIVKHPSCVNSLDQNVDDRDKA